MKRMIAAVLSIALVFSLYIPSFAAESEEYDGYIVSLKETEMLSLQSAEDCGLRELGGGIYHAEDISGLSALVGSGIVEYIEPNYKMYLQDYAPLWNMAAVNAVSAWEHTDAGGKSDLRGDGVLVAVIDSGVYAEHPDLAGTDILDFIDLTGQNTAVDTTHGTQVTGILAAGLDNGIGVDGAVPNVSILPIKITSGGETSNALAIEAVNLAVEMGADIINISIGGKKANSGLEEACAAAAEAGVIIVSAAGNYTSGTKSSSNYMYPASFESTVSVSACKTGGGDIMFDDEYSYFNSMVEVSAPGTDIRSLSIDGGTMTGKGTSFAAPHVTALAVMMKQRSSNADVAVFRELLEASCADLGKAGRDEYYGYGFADMEAFAALVADEQTVNYYSGSDNAEFEDEPGGYFFSSDEFALPQPVMEGYEFLGWYDNAELSGEIQLSIAPHSFGERSFYAAWEKAESEDPPAVDPEDPPAVDPEDPPAVDPEDPPAVDPEDPPAVDPEDPPAVDPEDPPAVDPEDTPAVDPEDPPVIEPEPDEPGVISAAAIEKALAEGGGMDVRLENASLQLSREAIQQLAEKEAEKICVSLSENGDGLELTFSADGEEFSLAAPVKIILKGYKGIPFFAAGEKEAAAVAVSSPVNGELRFVIPGSGSLSFEQVYSSFADINGHWAAVSALFVANRGIFRGDGVNFMPSDSMTRAMFATVLGRIYERSYGSIEVEGGGYFADCDYDSWYGPYVDWCCEAGIVQGDGKGNFDPEGEINRAQMAAMIYRFAAYVGLETELADGEEFSDSADIPAWALTAAEFCLNAGIMGGVGEGRFAPSDKATRAQCAAVLQRLIVYALA